MNFVASEVDAYLESFTAGLDDAAPDAQVAFYPSALWLGRLVAKMTSVATPVLLGGQDLHPLDSGAHTGDISGTQLASGGCNTVLCGHSERRQDHGEDDQLVAAKTGAALGSGLLPVVCVGESLEEREREETNRVLERQISAVLATVLDVTADGAAAPGAPIVVAYEPIWAIGTGRTATPDLAQGAHAAIRSVIHATGGDEMAAATRILYGGSVKPSNCEELIAQEDVDGFLIGGASLDPDSFLDIIKRCG